MNKLIALVAATMLASPAVAAVPVLSNVAKNGTFTYNTTFGPDEGIRAGDKVVIFDFAGYIPNSIFANAANVTSHVEFTTATPVEIESFKDNDKLVNLVFTYTGPNFQNTGGPFQPFDFTSGAKSRFKLTTRDNFYTLTTKNNAPANTPIYTYGSVTVPTAEVPEPATWAMIIGGLGLVGAAARQRRPILRLA